MKTNILFIILFAFSFIWESYGQENIDSLSNQSNSTTDQTESTSANEPSKSWELRGSLRVLGKVFSESPNETDLLESRLKLELISTLGKKSAFRAMGYTVHQYPQKQLKFDLKEAYIDYYTKFIDFRVGQQTIAWGKADEINPTDIINPQDMNNITEDKSVRKIGLFQTKADIKFYDFVLTAIWKPAFEYMQIPDLDSRWAFFSIPGVTSLPSPVYPENKLANSEWAFKLARTVSSVDFSLSYFDGWDNIFTPVITVDNTTHQISLDKLETHRTKMLGADFSTSIMSAGFWGEGAYFLTEDDKGNNPNIKNPYIQYVFGADYEFKNNYKINIQYFQEIVTKTGDDAEKTSEENLLSKLGIGLPLQQALTCRFEKEFGQTEEYKFELFGIYDLKHSGALIIPKFFYTPEDGFTIEAGYNLFDGVKKSFWSRFQHNDQVYLKCTYSF
jgi:hypothetical protein